MRHAVTRWMKAAHRSFAIVCARALVKALQSIHTDRFVYKFDPDNGQALVPMEDFGEQVIEVQRLSKKLAVR